MPRFRRQFLFTTITIAAILPSIPAAQSAKPTMKAIVVHEYGQPEVAKFEDAPVPVPKENEALVRVIAAGVNPADRHFAQILRSSGKPVVLVANKSEGRASDSGFFEAYSLGFGEPVAISAEHGEGLVDLVADMLAALGLKPVVRKREPPSRLRSFSIPLRARVSATSRAVSSAEKISVVPRPKTRSSTGLMSG